MLEDWLTRLRPALSYLPGGRSAARRIIGFLPLAAPVFGRLPLVGSSLTRLHERLERWRFSGEQVGAFYGAYASFEQARADAPTTKPFGYDHEVMAAEYRRQLLEEEQFLEPYHAPVLAILQSLIRNEPRLRIADLGGNVGTQYYGYREHLAGTEWRWKVVEVPAIASAGAAIARERTERQLTFTSSLHDALPADVLIATGSMAYLDQPLAVLADALLPAHVILNRVPLGRAQSFVTLQNGGPVFYAHWVFNDTELLQVMTRSGYELVETWIDDVDRCTIPMHAELSVRAYTGLYFRRRPAAETASAPNPQRVL